MSFLRPSFAGFHIGSSAPDEATLRIAQIEAALGSAITSTQADAIGAWVDAAKSAGAWASLKRFNFPTWANAAANAICLRSGTAGSFGGTLTHGAGYVQSPDATGYFDLGATASSLGLAPTSGWLGAIMVTAVSNHQYLGAQNGTQAALLRHTSTPQITTDYGNTTSGNGRYATTPVTDNQGIISMTVEGDSRKHFQRRAAGRSMLGEQVATLTSPAFPDYNLYAISKNNAGSPSAGGTSQMGGWWVGTGVSDAVDEAFTAATKTLWETCTGLTLP